LLRLAASLLLAMIVADVAADASCDLPDAQVRAEATLCPANTSANTEPCASFCVPDCFCCSRSVGAAAVIAPPRPVLLKPVDAPAMENRPEGVRPVIDHPPVVRG